MLCFSDSALAEQSPSPSPSFSRAPFVNPRIIKELTTWLSDSGDTVVAINLDGAQDSNRFSLYDAPPEDQNENAIWQTVIKNKTGFPTVCAENYLEPEYRHALPAAKEHDCYQYIGRSEDGQIVLNITQYEDDGTGFFQSLLVLQEQQDRNIHGDVRHLLFKLGEFVIGDRVPVERVTLSGRRVIVAIENQSPKVFDLMPVPGVKKSR